MLMQLAEDNKGYWKHSGQLEDNECSRQIAAGEWLPEIITLLNWKITLTIKKQKCSR